MESSPANPSQQTSGRNTPAKPTPSSPTPSGSTPVLPKRALVPRLLLLAIIVGGIAAGYVWYRRLHRDEDRHQLVLQGNVDVRQVNLAFKVEGRIVELGVDEGDRVKPGQVI